MYCNTLLTVIYKYTLHKYTLHNIFTIYVTISTCHNNKIIIEVLLSDVERKSTVSLF